MSKAAFDLRVSSDKVLGAVGGGLAAASLTFGIYMNVHGPVPGLGTSHDFTVFAQLAPKRQKPAQPNPEPVAPADDQLDMTATASIQKTSAKDAAADTDDRLEAENAVDPSVTLEAASSDVATISIDGRAQTVHIGDLVPGAGKVLEIRPGRHAIVKTSRGLILSARQD